MLLAGPILRVVLAMIDQVNRGSSFLVGAQRGFSSPAFLTKIVDYQPSGDHEQPGMAVLGKYR